MPDIPPPQVSTIDLIRQVGLHNLLGSGLSDAAKAVLSNALDEYQHKVRFMLAVYGNSKMVGLNEIVSATSYMETKLRDRAYLDNLATRHPAEFRKHYMLLKQVERDDVEFLRSQSAESAEKEGFAKDPLEQFKRFFQRAIVESLIPKDMGVDERRKTRMLISEIFALAEGKKPIPPSKPSRVVEAEFEPAERLDQPDRGIGETNGNQPTGG